MTIQRIDIDGTKLVILTQAAFDVLMEKAGVLPPLPPVDKHGNADAIAFGRAAIARKLVSRRIQAGWTQKELAKKPVCGWKPSADLRGQAFAHARNDDAAGSGAGQGGRITRRGNARQPRPEFSYYQNLSKTLKLIG